jgi:patatin-like phospholipase/acyl hydrolase
MPEPSKLRILSIDGGGIRGILPAKILEGLEDIIRTREGPKARVVDYFDLIAGTSTGGLLTCMMLSPHNESDASSLVDVYENHGAEIFRRSLNQFVSSYRKSGIEQFLDRQFGDLRLNELDKPCLITAYETKRRKPFFFRQHRAIQHESHNFFVKDVARATSAAPTYFPPAQIISGTNIRYPLVDGGVFANNPAMCALVEGLTLNWTDGLSLETPQKEPIPQEEIIVLSLGTGKEREHYRFEKTRNFNKLTWLKPLIEFMMDGNADTIHYQLEKLYSKSKNSENQYLRINPSLDEATRDLDDVTDKNLKALREAGQYAVEKNSKKLHKLAELLIKQKTPRKHTPE